MKVLFIEPANEEGKEHPWNEETQRKFSLDEDDIERLEADKVVWRGTTAYSLEEPEGARG